MKQYFIILFVTFFVIMSIGSFVTANETKKTEDDSTVLATKEMTIEEKRAIRKENLPKLISKYEDNHTFAEMHQYMLSKYKENKKRGTPPDPNQLIVETLDKSSKLFEKIRSFVGNNFKRQYNPEVLEANFKKYLWLKGICFTFLGIGDEHKIAVSYFYHPDHESIKREFMIDTVKYSYPEVLDVPENEAWFEEMGKVMERIAFRAFDVEKYYPQEKNKK